MPRRRKIVHAALAVACLAGTALAATPDEIIATRQAGYKHIGDISDAMKKTVESGGEVSGYAAPAKEIQDWSIKLIALFPPGTEIGHDTKARPEIWTNKADFEAKATALGVEAGKLSTIAATGDKDAFADGFKGDGRYLRRVPPRVQESVSIVLYWRAGQPG